MTDRNDNTAHAEQGNKRRPNTFHEAFSKTEINPKGLTQVTPKPQIITTY